MSDNDLYIASVGDPARHDAAAWFARLRADDVSEAERSAFHVWLSGDAGHRKAYERLEALWSDFGTHAERPEMKTLLGADAEPKSRRTAGRQRSEARRLRTWVAAAAVLALIALAGGWTAWYVQPPSPQTYTTAVGQQRTLTLEDGSQVTMDTDTRLRVVFEKHARRIKLEHGRAFFHVAKDIERPFLVTANGSVVRAVGTRFDVYEHNNEVDVTLVQGRVVVTWHGNQPGALSQQTIMEAGQRLVVDKDHAQPVLEAADTTATAWLSGKLVFNDTPLPVAVAQFNRYSTNKITVGDTKTARLRVTGVFRSNDNRAFVDALKMTYSVDVTHDKVNMLVLSLDHSNARAGLRH